jgi:predicted enzyme related to lactoylglutathione lyase
VGTTKGRVAQFTIYADDPETVASFYAAVFGWSISGLNIGEGQPRALIINDPRSGSGAPLRGHVSTRKGDSPVGGFACTIAVASLTRTEAAIRRHGGVILDTFPFIKGVGGRIRFQDPGGNVVEAFQFSAERRRGATSNKRMQLTRSARVNGRRGPRS